MPYIKIENFGPIKNGEVNISKPLVLIGPNGSGKSYLALLIHTLLNSLDKYKINKYMKDSNTSISLNSKPSTIKKEKLINEDLRSYVDLVENELKNTFNIDNLDELIKSNSNYFTINFNEIKFIKERNKDFYISEFPNEFKNIIFKNLAPNKSFFIPTIREEILKNNLLKESSSFSILLNINQDSKKGKYYNLACKIEKDVLNGEITVENIDSNLELYFENLENNIKIPLNLGSSAIKELAPFILYLKFLPKPGNTLIIEEPEAHIHPETQRKLVKYFVELYNQDLNIIFTTHSDYIVVQINNHIRLNDLPTKIINEKFDNFTKLDALNFNNFNIYDFKENTPFDFSIFRIEINSTGFDEDNFEKVSSELYDETNKIIDAKGEW